MKRLWGGRPFYFVFLFLMSSSILQAAETKYFVSVDEPRADASAEGPRWCTLMHEWLTLIEKKPVDISCALMGVTSVAQIEAAKQQGFRYHFRLVRKQKGEIELAIENWAKDDDTDFVQAGPWTFQPGLEQLTLVKLELNRFFLKFHRVKRIIKETALLNGIRQSKRVNFDSQSGEYQDRVTQQPIPFDQAYSLFTQENRKNKHYLTAVLELSAVLGGGSCWYWSNQELNSVDWEMRWDWPSWRQKIWFPFKGVSFDNNSAEINAVAHPGAGFIYYYLSRENNLSILDSFLLAFTASSLWEYVGEFREKVSLNDMIATPVGGMAIGEVIYQLGEFFEQSEPNTLTFVLSSIFGGQAKLHQYLDGYKTKRVGPFDRLGFTKNIWHEFSVYVAGVKGFKTSSLEGVDLGLRTEIISAPFYGRPGKVKTLLWDGGFSELSLQRFFGLPDSGVAREFNFFVKAALAGYYRQSIEKNGSDSLQGYSFFVGAGTGYHFTKRDGTVLDQSDMMGVVNVLGPVIDFVYYTHGAKVRAQLQVYGDFAMVKSLAAFDYVDSNEVAGIKSLLQMKEKYYYAFGVTVAPSLSVQVDDFEWGGRVRFEDFESIEGRDRMQLDVSNDFHLRDQRLSHESWLAYTLPVSFPKFKVVVGLEYTERRSDIPEFDIRKKRTDLVGSGKLVVLF